LLVESVLCCFFWLELSCCDEDEEDEEEDDEDDWARSGAAQTRRPARATPEKARRKLGRLIGGNDGRQDGS